VKFGEIDSYVLFGGGTLLLETALSLREQGRQVAVFSSARHLEESADNGSPLAERLASADVPSFDSPDINKDDRLADHVGSSTLGIAFGPAWIFREPVCKLFGDRFVNFMGIDLPRYRGGAHYTWQILQQNRVGAVNLQLINEVVDSGAVIKHREFRFPSTARIPSDYYAAADEVNREFMREFLQEVGQNAEFTAEPLQEKYSQYFPYLNTRAQGWVNWDWGVEEIEAFIGAFSHPYPGASTFIEDRPVQLHQAASDFGDGRFHPFMAGLIYRASGDTLFVACRGGSLVLGQVLDEGGNDLTAELGVGRRFHTPRQKLDEAMAYRAVYGSSGPKDQPGRSGTPGE
jgi:methionyl-tRNA formyltransferase